jgi:phage-related protein
VTNDAANLKPVVWVGSARRDLQALSVDVQDDVGFALYQVQRGEKPDNAKPLKGFGGAHVQEIVTDDQAGTYRCVYTVKFAEAVYVHTFQKKSKSGIATPKAELDLVRERLKLAQQHHDQHMSSKRERP